MKTPHEFYLETDGRIIDVDHEYGGQCWDLFALFCLEYCNKTFGCIKTGYVIDLWTEFDRVGLGEYFEKVPNNALQDGDWAIWTGPCMITNHSHIAMFRIDDENGGGIFLTQNPNGNPNYTHQMWISYQGLVGGLRPKCYITQDKNLPNPVEENKEVDQFKVNCDDTMRVRLGHNLNAEIIGSAQTGFYNILNRCDDDGYTWFEVEKNKWIALLPPYSDYIPKEEKPEPTPEPEPQPEPTPTPEPEPIPDENIFVKIIKFIIEILRKILNKGDK